MIKIFVKFLLLMSFCHNRPSKRSTSLSDYKYYLKRLYYPELERLKAKFGEMDQAVINYEQIMKEERKRTRINISPDKMDDQNRGYVFQVEFKSGTLEVVLFKTRYTGQCYLRITGPDGFQFGHKWRETMEIDEWGQMTDACTKASKIDLMEILEQIDGVEYEAFSSDGATKEQWLNNSQTDNMLDGQYVYIRDNCIPDLSYKLATEKKFNSKIFNGNGIKFHKSEIKIIENAKKGFLNNCDYFC